MNKKQKILTAVALAAFSVIIALHYGWWPCYYPECAYSHHSHAGGFLRSGAGAWGLWPHSLIWDIHMPLFVLGVFYAGLFFILRDARPGK